MFMIAAHLTIFAEYQVRNCQEPGLFFLRATYLVLLLRCRSMSDFSSLNIGSIDLCLWMLDFITLTSELSHTFKLSLRQ
jgi:hypothetical protein